MLINSTSYERHLQHDITIKGDDIYGFLLEKIRQECGHTAFDNWFSHLRFESLEQNVLTLTAPSKFIKDWIVSNYFLKIYKILEAFEDVISRIDINVDIATNDVVLKQQQEYVQSNTITHSDFQDDIGSALDHKMVFANFVTDASNKMAYTMAQKMAGVTDQSTSFLADCKVLYIQGKVGMGKTHLLQSIANYVKKSDQKLKIAYLSAEKFMHLYMLAVRKNQLVTFKEKLRDVDLLLFDDLHFICGKASTQKEFANTVNALLERNKRVVVACDRSSYQLDLDTRTKSIISSGIIAEIRAADFNLRFNILKEKAIYMKAVIDDHILKFLAEQISCSIRELEGALNKLFTYCYFNELPITIENCKNTLHECIQANKSTISIQDIINKVAALKGVEAIAIISKSRLAELVNLRQMIAYLAKEYTDYSLQAIGKELGNKDHATVIYYINQFKTKLDNNVLLQEEIKDITSRLHHD